MPISEIEQLANNCPQLLRDFLKQTIEECSNEFLLEFFKADLGLDSDLQEYIDKLTEKEN